MKKIFFALLLFSVLSVGCGRKGDYAPKPVAFLRIDTPAHTYCRYDTTSLPFTFERAQCAEVGIKRNRPTDKWVDILYPQFQGVVYLSYRKMDGVKDLKGQVDTSYLYLTQHFDYAAGVEEKAYSDASRKVYATTYHLKGDNVASTFQFWATDSNQHFLRGSLFLDRTPNNDSLAPVIEYLQADIRHLLETLEWR